MSTGPPEFTEFTGVDHAGLLTSLHCCGSQRILDSHPQEEEKTSAATRTKRRKKKKKKKGQRTNERSSIEGIRKH
jgi:hypothetical protein